MWGRREERIEAAVDHLAAAVLGGAAGYLLFGLLGPQLPAPQLAVATAFGSALTYLVTCRLLRAVQSRSPPFEIPVFRMTDLELADAGELLLTEQAELLLTEQVELVLTDADRVQPPHLTAADELVLDDILSGLEPDSRVVRLFDPAAVQTPGQLRSRIDQYLQEDAASPPTPDASKALYDALAELRRSLR